MSKRTRTTAEFRLNSNEIMKKLKDIIDMNFVLVLLDKEDKVITASTLPPIVAQKLLTHIVQSGALKECEMTKKSFMDDANPSSN